MIKVITYHYVRPDSERFPYLKYLPLDCFRRELDLFEDKYGFVSKESFHESLKQKKVIEPGIILTFDDGFADHYNWVYPELLRRGLWGIFFIPTGQYRQQRLLGVHRVHALAGAFDSRKILNEALELVDESMLDKDHIEEFDKHIYRDQDNPNSLFLLKRLFNYFLYYEYRDKLLDILMSKRFNEEELCKAYYLTTAEIRKMENNGMWIGAHTETHPVLGRLDTLSQEREIKRSIEYLEQEVGIIGPRTFCYPYGGPFSFNDKTINLLKANKVVCAFDFDVTNPRNINDDDFKLNLFALPRIDCNKFM